MLARMKPCPYCSQPAPPEANFCGHCGASLRITPSIRAGSAVKPCPYCSQPAPPEANFCGHCGTSFRAGPSVKAEGNSRNQHPLGSGSPMVTAPGAALVNKPPLPRSDPIPPRGSACPDESSTPEVPPNPAKAAPPHPLPPHPQAGTAPHGVAPPSPSPPLGVSESRLSYLAYWGLSILPFENVPDPRFYFASPTHEEARHRLLYGIESHKGALLLTGEVGSGKTLLSRELVIHLSSQHYDTAIIPNPSFNVEEFLAEVLYQLGIEPRGTKVQLLHLLNERLISNYKRGKQTVVLIDEAHTIPHEEIFEELRLLLNFQLNDRFLLTLILLGQPELRSRIAAIKPFAQRIAISYHLTPLSAPETADYIRFRLKVAGSTREIFHSDTLDHLFTASRGIPRNLNTLCDLCLLIGFLNRTPLITHSIVSQAIGERSSMGLL
jgi:general secretion pathway protein A